jgi:hypothetical protein
MEKYSNNELEVKYDYLFRPGYHSKKWLIEIVNGDELHVNIFLDSISKLSPKIVECDLSYAVADELLLKIETNIGIIEFHRDFWGFIFILSDNDICINEIDSILENHKKFMKKDADIEKYK